MIRFKRTAKTILAPALDRCRSCRRDATRIVGASAASAQATPRGFLVIENGIAVSGLVTVGSFKDALVAFFFFLLMRITRTVTVAEVRSVRIGQLWRQGAS
jgi:hypothetical protein